MTTDTRPVARFIIGDRVRIREEHRREDDFTGTAIVTDIETDDTIDIAVDGRDWGQWFCRLDDGTYEIELA